MKHLTFGLALEFYTDQLLGAIEAADLDFVEFGIHLRRGVPAWLAPAVGGRRLNLHPLDVNLAGGDFDDGWASALRAVAGERGASALVSDLGYWYHAERSATWERPANMSGDPRVVGRTAARIANAVGLPFRIENPPLEWMPGSPSIWHYLDRASDFAGVEICLDLSHLRQFQQNVAAGHRALPAQFPWERIAEVHLAGYLQVEFGGRVFFLDQHAARIGDDQLRLLDAVLARRSPHEPLQVCLEMEPHGPGALVAALARVKSSLAVSHGPRAG